MTKITYPATSPYASTNQVNIYLEYLDYWKGWYPTYSEDDQIITVQDKYHNRPDLLSYDSYGSPGWWWVFAVRNPDIIRDPIYDLKAGVTIYIPSKESLPRSST